MNEDLMDHSERKRIEEDVQKQLTEVVEKA